MCRQTYTRYGDCNCQISGAIEPCRDELTRGRCRVGTRAVVVTGYGDCPRHGGASQRYSSGGLSSSYGGSSSRSYSSSGLRSSSGLSSSYSGASRGFDPSSDSLYATADGSSSSRYHPAVTDTSYTGYTLTSMGSGTPDFSNFSWSRHYGDDVTGSDFGTFQLEGAVGGGYGQFRVDPTRSSSGGSRRTSYRSSPYTTSAGSCYTAPAWEESRYGRGSTSGGGSSSFPYSTSGGGSSSRPSRRRRDSDSDSYLYDSYRPTTSGGGFGSSSGGYDPWR